MRRTYDESCAELQRSGLLEPGQIPPMPDRRPLHDDSDPLGVSFFRTWVEGDLSGMTLPRTFFGRSQIEDASFKDTDLSESTLCWCDFIHVDFSDACLRECDLRASIFEHANFSRCDLRGADLRRSSFNQCNFSDAQMQGTKLTRDQLRQLVLSVRQQVDVNWQRDDGSEPGGG